MNKVAFVLLSFGLVFGGAVWAQNEGVPQYGGTLTVVNFLSQFEPASWDPNDMNYLTMAYTGGIYETLLQGDLSKGPGGTNQWPFVEQEYVPTEYLKGCLAESWDMPDPGTVIYHIRKGVYWPDKPGVMKRREYTAEDAAYSCNRFFQTAGFPSPGVLDFLIHGKAEATDRYTLTLKFANGKFDPNWIEYTGFFWLCADWGYPKELVKAGFKWQNVTGTGQFMLTEYVSGAYLTYTRNPNYWGKLVVNLESNINYRS